MRFGSYLRMKCYTEYARSWVILRLKLSIPKDSDRYTDMKKIILTVAVLTGLISLNATVQQEPKKQKKGEAVSVLAEDSVDPVCRMKVKKGSKITHVHKEKQYGFCSEGCKALFVKSPEKFLKSS